MEQRLPKLDHAYTGESVGITPKLLNVAAINRPIIAPLIFYPAHLYRFSKH